MSLRSRGQGREIRECTVSFSNVCRFLRSIILTDEPPDTV